MEVQRYFHFECSDSIEIHDGIMLVFYLELPHVKTFYVMSRIAK